MRWFIVLVVATNTIDDRNSGESREAFKRVVTKEILASIER